MTTIAIPPVGSTVTFLHPRTQAARTGTLTKINPKSVRVDVDGTTWRVPHGLLVAPGQTTEDKAAALATKMIEREVARHTPTASTGDLVTITANGRWHGVRGKVLKINRTRALVSTERGRVNVPFTLMTPVTPKD